MHAAKTLAPHPLQVLIKSQILQILRTVFAPPHISSGRLLSDCLYRLIFLKKFFLRKKEKGKRGEGGKGGNRGIEIFHFLMYTFEN